MAWQTEWGPKIPKLREIEQATGVTPPAILDEPQLYGPCVELAYAYNVLASKRSFGLSPNPIQLSEINAFLDRYGEPSIPIDVFIDLMGRMDCKYLELSHGKSAGNR